MLRAAFTFASLISLLLALAVAAIWPRSYLRWDMPWFQIGRHAGEIHVADGVLVVVLDDSAAPALKPKWIWRSYPANQNGFGDEALTLYNAPEHRHFPAVSWDRIRSTRFIGFPLSLLMLPLLPLPLAWLSFHRRRSAARRRKLGLCPQCGYSLQGISSKACPECGGPISSAANPQA